MTATEYKATRKRLGTQAEVASLLGVNRVTVAKRESGTMTITNEAVLAIQSLRRPRGKRKSEKQWMVIHSSGNLYAASNAGTQKEAKKRHCLDTGNPWPVAHKNGDRLVKVAISIIKEQL
jgi:DNA-binding XRE family transcriptional regulator